MTDALMKFFCEFIAVTLLPEFEKLLVKLNRDANMTKPYKNTGIQKGDQK